MNETLESELARIFDAVVIETPQSFRFRGSVVQVVQSTAPQTPVFLAPTNPLTGSLQLVLYQHCYCQRFTPAATETRRSEESVEDLTSLLTQANSTVERWDAGWQIIQLLPSGQTVGRRNGMLRLIWPGEFLSQEGGQGIPQPGSYISIFCKKHSISLQPGFYFAFGETIADQEEENNLIRLYWHIQRGGILELLKSLTRALNRFQVPFRFKCPARVDVYQRSDAGVLYFAKRYYRSVSELLTPVYDQVAKWLEAETPLFSKRLAPGLALAEDPGYGESFGMNRCRLVAEGIWSAYTQNRQDPEGRLAEVIKQFDQHGGSLKWPYLNRGSVDVYDWPSPMISLQ